MLFRQEVLVAKSQSDKAITLIPPKVGWWLFVTGIAIIAGILTILLFARYSRHEKVSGYLVPRLGATGLVAQTDAVVSRILVTEGSSVRAGDALIEISQERESLQRGGIYADMSRQLYAKRSLLEVDLSQATSEANRKVNAITQRISLIEDQKTQVIRQIELEKEPTASARELYIQWQHNAAKGFVSKAQLLQQQDALLQHETKSRSLDQQRLQLQQSATDARAELDGIASETARSRRDIERQIADIDTAISSNAAHQVTVLRATGDGTVSNIMVHCGQTVDARQSLLTILPAGSTLLAELWLPSRAIGFLDPKADVGIRYEAYPYQKFGVQHGRVIEIGRNAVLPSDISRRSGKEFKEPQYRVLVELDRQAISAYGRDEGLKAGMALSADIVLDRRRLFEWVFEPLYGIRNAMIRTNTGPSRHG